MRLARLAPEEAVFRPALPLRSLSGFTEKQMSRLTYVEQLKHPNWQRKRLEILNRDEFMCQICYDDESTLHVHHKHYFKGRMAWEYENYELVTLCESCHEGTDDQSVAFKKLWAMLRVDGPFSVGDATGLIAGWANLNVGYDLSEYRSVCPYNFVLGEIAQAVDCLIFHINELTALRDALLSIHPDDRKKELLSMVANIEANYVLKG